MVTNSQSQIDHDLWNTTVNSDSYGNRQQFFDYMFEQYKLCVEMADRISVRRGLANNFFITLNTLLVTAIGLVYKQDYRLQPRWLILFILITTLTLCWSWYRTLESYRQLNVAKYLVIGAYEKKLPSMPFVSAEWKVLGEGRDPSVFSPLGDSERIIPFVFAILYIFGALAITFF